MADFMMVKRPLWRRFLAHYRVYRQMVGMPRWEAARAAWSLARG